MASQITNLASVIHILWKLLKYYNVDPMGVFREVQLDPELMKKPGARLKLEVIERAWELADAMIKYPCFGLSASAVWYPSDLGVLGYAILASDTLRDCPKITSRFRISSSGYPEMNFNHKILNVARLRLRFCSISSTQPDPNLSAPSSNLLLDSPLALVADDRVMGNQTYQRHSVGCVDYLRTMLKFDESGLTRKKVHITLGTRHNNFITSLKKLQSTAFACYQDKRRMLPIKQIQENWHGIIEKLRRFGQN